MLVGERAAAAVALEDLTFDGVRDVTRRRCVRVFGRSLSRLPTGPESLLLDLFNQQIERILDDRRQVSVGDAVAEQILGLAELVMTRATRGELELASGPGAKLEELFGVAPLGQVGRVRVGVVRPPANVSLEWRE